MNDIISNIKEVLAQTTQTLLEAADPNLKPGQVKPIPGKGQFKAMNKKGSVKVFPNSALAQKFAMSESRSYDDAITTGLDKFGVESLSELEETQVPEFFAFVEKFYSTGE